VALPFHHRDPFDRLIAVQAKIEKMPLVSADPAFDAYAVKRIW
ncbi:MAG: PIN domain nuclease, partial [Anaerolinea sp.]|nr:PIN domain nuclease [Anaerolinea sp.]